MTTALLIAAFICLAAALRISRTEIPDENSTPRDLNRRRASHTAAALNLSRAVRRIK